MNLDDILDTEKRYLNLGDKIEPLDFEGYTAHTDFLRQNDLKIMYTEPDNRHIHITVYNGEGQKLKTKRYEI